MNQLRSVPRALAGLAASTPAPTAQPPREMRLCDWCSRVATGRDETGAPACRDHVSEAAADRVQRPSRQHACIRPVIRDRDIHNFVIAEFRSFGACV